MLYPLCLYTRASPTSKIQTRLCRLPSNGRLVLSEYPMSECCCMRLLIGLSREQMKISPTVPIPFSWPSFCAVPLFLIILNTLHRPLDLERTFGGHNYGKPLTLEYELIHATSIGLGTEGVKKRTDLSSSVPHPVTENDIGCSEPSCGKARTWEILTYLETAVDISKRYQFTGLFLSNHACIFLSISETNKAVEVPQSVQSHGPVTPQPALSLPSQRLRKPYRSCFTWGCV